MGGSGSLILVTITLVKDRSAGMHMIMVQKVGSQQLNLLVNMRDKQLRLINLLRDSYQADRNLLFFVNCNNIGNSL